MTNHRPNTYRPNVRMRRVSLRTRSMRRNKFQFDSIACKINLTTRDYTFLLAFSRVSQQFDKYPTRFRITMQAYRLQFCCARTVRRLLFVHEKRSMLCSTDLLRHLAIEYKTSISQAPWHERNINFLPSRKLESILMYVSLCYYLAILGWLACVNKILTCFSLNWLQALPVCGRAVRQESCATAIAKMTAQCALRPIYGCPEKFRKSLTTPTGTFPKI